MPPAHNFEYLPLVFRKQGPARYPQVVIAEDPQAAANRQNRATHSGNLQARTTNIVNAWQAREAQREIDGLPEIKGIPLLLKIDQSLDIDALRQTFQFEIVAEEPDGFVIVASDDISLAQFRQKLTDFVASIEGSANVARILDLREDTTQAERLQRILLEPGIDKASSHCFLPGRPETDVADYVRPSGHGTRVAGAVLHGEEVPKAGTVKLETWVQNARVLNDDCDMPKELFPPAVLREAVQRYHLGQRKTRIFNHSINADVPSRTVHMSAWAAEIDRLSYEHDILIVQSAGNLKCSRPAPRLGIQEHLAGGTAYPDYLSQPNCRVANPAQSLQALSVGSVGYGAFEQNGYCSFVAQAGEPSAFSRCGPGIWGTIKPEVVEYGGDCLRTAGGAPTVTTPAFAKQCYPELVASTMHGSPACERDEVGTSYAAPKVTKIASRLQATLPDETCLLYRALIVQSARWPQWAGRLSPEQQTQLLRRIGYGIPDLKRSTENDDYRSTFISHGEQEIAPGACQVYQVRIPEQLRRPGADYEILIEATLSYAAEPRRTRRNPRGYLAVWVDWVSSRRGESPEAFLSRAIREAEKTDEGTSFGWTIETNPNTGRLPGVRRNIGTVQKDWAVLKSNALPEDFCIAVRGHKGWSKDPDVTARYALAVSFEILGKEIPIYEPLRAAVLELQAEVQAEAEVEVEVPE